MSATPAAPLRCGNCDAPMRELRLAGHYGSSVVIDLCDDCDLLWFDDVETARLSGPGMLELIGAMSHAQGLPHRSLRAGIACPRCRGPLRDSHNRSRWGRSMQLACGQRHGAHQSFAQFLSEKGLTRPLSSADRARLLQREGSIFCINCGAAIDAADERCRWCESVPMLIDIARLAGALDPEGATAGHPVHATATRTAAFGCVACGSAVPREAAWSCPQCGATLVAAGLAEARRRIAELGPALQAHALRPAPAIVERRLRTHDAAMQRQREWAARMSAEADARSGAPAPWQPGPFELPAWRAGWLAAVLALLAIWLWW